MLIQAMATGINNVIERCAGRRIPGIWENPSLSRSLNIKGFIQYHKICDAIEGGVVGLTAPYMLGLNANMKPDERPLFITTLLITTITGTALGAMAGIARAVRILKGIDFIPYHYNPISGLIVGAAIGSISGEPRIIAIGAATGTVLGTLVMTARIAKDMANKHILSLIFSQRH